jgi:hypothetical protein
VFTSTGAKTSTISPSWMLIALPHALWQLAEAIANPERQSSFEGHAKKSFSIHAHKTAIAKAIRLVRSKSVRTQS